MKKIFALLIAFAMLFAFASCAGKEKPEETTAPTQSNTEAQQTSPVVTGKTIMLKDNDSLNFVEINTDTDNVGTTIMIHKFFSTENEYVAAKEKGSYDKYTLITAIDASRQIIYTDGETVKGMAYDEILALAEKAEGYTIIPEAE